MMFVPFFCILTQRFFPRGKYQGLVSGAIALGYAIGPPIGGALAQRVSWRVCFSSFILGVFLLIVA